MEIKQSTIAKSEELINAPVVTPATEPIVPVTAPPSPTEPTEITIPVTEPTTVVEPIVTETAVAPQDEVIAFDFPVDEVVQPVQETTTTQTSQPVNWRDAIKEVPEDEIAELLGDDDFIKGMRKHIKNGGKPIDYLTAHAVNWESVSDSDIIKSELRADFPDATSAQIERLFNKKYNQVDTAEDEDKEDGILLMKSDARKLRSQKIDNQKKFQIADARIITQPPVVQSNPADEQAKTQYKKDIEYIHNHSVTKQLFESKRVAIEVAEGVKLNMGIKNPEALMEVWSKPGKLLSLTRTPQGEPDVELMQEAAMFFSNRAAFKRSIYNAGKEAGAKSLIDEGQNAGKQASVVPMLAGGVQNYGEAFNSGNLKTGNVKQHLGI